MQRCEKLFSLDLFSLEGKIPYNITGNEDLRLEPNIEEIAKKNIRFEPSIPYWLLLTTPYHIDPDKIPVRSSTSDPAIIKAVEKYIESGHIRQEDHFNEINSIKPDILALEISIPFFIACLTYTNLDIMYATLGLDILGLATLYGTRYIGNKINNKGKKTSIFNIRYLEDELNKEIKIKKRTDDIDPRIDGFNHYLNEIGPYLIKDAKEEIIKQHGSPDDMQFFMISYPDNTHYIDSGTTSLSTTMYVTYLCKVGKTEIYTAKVYELKIYNNHHKPDIGKYMDTLVTHNPFDPNSESEIQQKYIQIKGTTSFQDILREHTELEEVYEEKKM